MSEINLNDSRIHKRMVNWFSPSVLYISAKQAVISALFGSFADRRLIHASLDIIDKEKLIDQIDFTNKITKNDNDEIWFDYVSDLGDGFDSTYTVAYLLGQKSIYIENCPKVLPRGSFLIMGGDEVYPTPTREEYKCRIETPYGYAYPQPKNGNKQTNAPTPLFLIPGNHDWYDGLNLFLAKFCRGEKKFLGESNWEVSQSRSYFAIKLINDWWILGIDTQLGEDIDQPQANYFNDIAKTIGNGGNPKFIICSATPSWLLARSNLQDEQCSFNRGVDSIVTDIIKKKCPRAKIYAILSGDQHHYNHYTASKSNTHFITAGGGGAFLHPTHHLKDSINDIWYFGVQQNLEMVKANENNDACFPSKKKSKKLAVGNWKFPITNWQFESVHPTVSPH